MRIRVGNRTVRSIFRRGDDVQVFFDPDENGMYPAPWYREAAQSEARRLLGDCQRCLDARRDEWDTLLEPVGNPHKLGLWRLDYDDITDPDQVVAAQCGVDTYGLVVRDGLVRAVIWEGNLRDIPALRKITIRTCDNANRAGGVKRANDPHASSMRSPLQQLNSRGAR